MPGLIPAQTWKEANMEILQGHNSQESAFIVEDYPYGFRLRTKIRYWVETVKGKGDRFVSQTLNPKTGRWNKPKKSTYSAVILIGKNEQGHIVNGPGISRGWSNEEGIQKFVDIAGINYPFNEYQQEQIKICIAIARTQKHVTCNIVNTTAWTPEQHQEHEQKQERVRTDLRKVFAHEYNQI